jgi:hypothetical protein
VNRWIKTYGASWSPKKVRVILDACMIITDTIPQRKMRIPNKNQTRKKRRMRYPRP